MGICLLSDEESQQQTQRPVASEGNHQTLGRFAKKQDHEVFPQGVAQNTSSGTSKVKERIWYCSKEKENNRTPASHPIHQSGIGLSILHPYSAAIAGHIGSQLTNWFG